MNELSIENSECRAFYKGTMIVDGRTLIFLDLFRNSNEVA